MKKIIYGMLLGLSISPVMAENSYITAELLLGNTTQEVNGSDGDDTSFGIRGSYNINQKVGFEVSYQNYGEASWSFADGVGDRVNESTDTSALNLAIRGRLPLQNGFSLHARAGLSFWDVDVEATASVFPGEAFTGSDSGNDLFYGIGAQYSVNDKYMVGLEYTLAEYDVSLEGDFDGSSTDLELDTLAITFGIKL